MKNLISFLILGFVFAAFFIGCQRLGTDIPGITPKSSSRMEQFSHNNYFYEMPVAWLDSLLEAELTTNSTQISRNSYLLSLGIGGLAKNSTVSTIVNNYEKARRKHYYNGDLEVGINEYPFLHLYILKSVCASQGIDIVSIMQGELSNFNVSQSEIDMIPTILDSFKVASDINYYLYPTIMMPYHSELREFEGWDGHSPEYISASQFKITSSSMDVLKLNHSTQSYEPATISDYSLLYNTPSWDVKPCTYKPLEAVRPILLRTSYFYRNVSELCSCSSKQCVNSASTIPNDCTVVNNNCEVGCATTANTTYVD